MDFPTPSGTGQIITRGSKRFQWTGEQWAAYNTSYGGPWSFKTSAYTAVDNDRIAANTSGGAFTITLPASPANGTNVTLVDAFGTWDTNNLTIWTGNALTIEGGDSLLECDVEGDMVITLLFNGTTWKVYV